MQNAQLNKRSSRRTLDNAMNNNTTVNNQLKHFGISKRLISRCLEVNEVTVRKALNIKTFKDVRPLHMSVIRLKTFELLNAAGFEGTFDDLWTEYDKRLSPEKAAA